MKWHYQPVERNGEIFIYEVFIDDDGNIFAYGDDKEMPCTTTDLGIEDLKEEFKLILEDLDRPIITHEDLVSSLVLLVKEENNG